MKIIKIESCCKCPNHIKRSCFLLNIEVGKVHKIENDDIIHPDCPLEDYQKCDCQPFQSCQKCKSQWLPLSDLTESKTVWIMDKNNLVGKGRSKQEEKRFRVYIIPEETPEEFEIPVLFADIKPPEI